MKALRFDGNLRYVPDYPDPVPGKGEALVRVKMAGICSTDLEILKGYMRFSGIPGHEFTGVVEACDNPGLMGKRVVDEITLIGFRCGPFKPAIRALAEKEVDVSSMMTAVYPLDQGMDVLKKASLPGILKVLLKMD